MLHVLQNNEGQLAVIVSLKRFEVMNHLDARLRTFAPLRVICQLPVGVMSTGLNQVIRSTVEAIGACYPQANAKNLGIVTATGEVLATGDKIALGKFANVPRWSVMRAHLQQLPLQWGGGRAWIVHRCVQY